MNEIWKKISDIPGYEEWSGLEISNHGRVKSYKRVPDGVILKQHVDYKGYVTISFRINKKMHTKKIHRLVALSFIKNIENKPQVNHINGNKSDNHIDNLEWATNSENQIHSYRVLKNKGRGGGNGVHARKKVMCIETNKIYNSITDCANDFNVKHAHISAICRKKRKTAKGYTFEFI